MAYHNGMKFSTDDKDNDMAGGSCAHTYHGAWSVPDLGIGKLGNCLERQKIGAPKQRK